MTASPPSPTGIGTDDSADLRELANNPVSQPPLDAEASLWAARRHDGLTLHEQADLQAWLAGDPARGARLAELEGVWTRLDDLPARDVQALRASAASRSSHAPRPAYPALRRDPPALLAGWGRLLPPVAVACAMMVVVGAGWLGWSHWQQQPVFSQRFSTLRGQQLSATLPEGSTLRLDTATRLDVALYRHRREVQLPNGQALFEVKPDAERPFQVLAGPMRITVLGTRFSVRYAKEGTDAGRVKVVVEEGRVRVSRVASAAGLADPAQATGVEESVELTAGQAVVADAQGHLLPVAAAFPGTSMAWRNGRLVLNDTPLGDAVAEFERYVDTGLLIRDPAVAALRLNGSFELKQVAFFRRALPQVLPVRLLAGAGGKTEVVAAD